MMFRNAFVVAVLVSATLTAQQNQCPETDKKENCSTCTAGSGSLWPTEYTFSAIASPTIQTPTTDCVPCSWDLSFHLGGPIDYSRTYIKVGGNAPVYTVSQGVIITTVATAGCDRTSEKTICVEFTETWDSFNPPLSWKTECIKLTCGLCPGGVG
jgi:hypothetical protein